MWHETAAHFHPGHRLWRETAAHSHPGHRTWHETAARSHPGHRTTVPSHLRRRSRCCENACCYATKEKELPVTSVCGPTLSLRLINGHSLHFERRSGRPAS